MMEVVCIRGQSGFQAGNRDLVRGVASQVHGLFKQIVAHALGAVASGAGGHTVGDHIANKGKGCARDHHDAPKDNGGNAGGGNHHVDDVAENVGDDQLNKGGGHFDGKPHNHIVEHGAQIFDQQFHDSCSSFAVRSRST